jgi:hypothetical protein
MPLAFIVLTQFSIVGTTLPAPARSNWIVRLLPVATSRRALRSAPSASFDSGATTVFSRAEATTSNCAWLSNVRIIGSDRSDKFQSEFTNPISHE